MDHPHRCIHITEERFKKSAQKLLRFVKDRQAPDSPPLTLSEMHETLSKSLGFRSFHDVSVQWSDASQGVVIPHTLGNSATTPDHSSITKAPVAFSSSSTQTPSSLSSISLLSTSRALPWQRDPQRFAQLLTSLMPEQATVDTWRERSLTLVSTVATLLSSMVERHEVLFNADVFGAYLILPNLIKARDREECPWHVKEAINAYLRAIPGHQERQPPSLTVLEQHGYLHMQLQPALHKLTLVEKSDFALLDISWLVLDAHVGFNLELNLAPALLEIEHIELSWLHHPAFLVLCQRLIANRKLSTFMLSNLLDIKSNMIYSESSAQLDALLTTLFANFHMAKNLSETIQARIAPTRLLAE